MERVDIITGWKWLPNGFRCLILDIRGGIISDPVRAKLLGSRPPDPPLASDLWRQGRNLAQALLARLPPLAPMDVGGSSQYDATITAISSVDSRSSSSPETIRFLSYVEYSNGVKTREIQTFQALELPSTLQRMNAQLHKKVNQYVKEWFAETYGGGEMNPEKWKAEKTEVFISHRDRASNEAMRLIDHLGEYEDRTLFVPRSSLVDMQAGTWLDQLMRMIGRCEVFIPILSEDYLEGPISRPEMDQALRQHFSQSEKRIVPVLIEGIPEDYQDHFIGGFQMVKAQEGMTAETLQEIADLALGLSRNPFDTR